jgi:hypothetical protein
MKKIFSPLTVITAGIAVFLITGCSNPNAEPLKIGDPMEEDLSERQQYDLMRLAGPDGKIPEHIREKELAFSTTLPSDRSVARFGPNAQSQAVWSQRGPWNVGGRTRAFGIDKNDENHLIAGSTSGGIWTSFDGGTNWSKVTPSLSYHGVSCLAQDMRPGHDSVWYAGSGEAYGQSASAGGNAYFLGNGVLKSTDNGATWFPLTVTVTNTPQTFESFWDFQWNIVLDENDTVNDVVYAANLGGIYRSMNGGTSWTVVRGGNLSNYSYFTDVAVTKDSGIVYATLSSDGPTKGIWRSIDQGTTWTKISTSMFGDSLCNRVVMGINPLNENEIYFLGNSEGLGMPDTNFQGDIEYNTLWRYTYIGGDGSGPNGMWEDLSMNLPTGEQWGKFSDFNAQGSYDLVVQVKPDDPNTVFIGGTNTYRNTNRFNDTSNTEMIGGYELFTDFPLIGCWPNNHPDNHGIYFLPSDPNVMFNNNDGGIFKTTDCMAPSVTWTSLNNGYFTTQFYTVAIDHGTAGSNIIAAGAQDNGTWWTNNATLTSPWTQPRGGDGSYCQIENGGGMYYFSIQKGKMNKATLDAAGNVTGARRIDPIGIDKDDYLFINPFTLDPNNQNIMYLAGAKYLWRNDNLSQIPLSNQWDSISTNWVQWADSVPLANSKITAVHACSSPANRVYYGTDKKRIFRVDNANTGTPTPVDISPSAAPALGYTSCVTTNPNDGNEIMVSYSNYSVYSIWHSVDGGTTWTKQAGNLEQNITSGSGNGPSVRWLSIIPVSDGTVYLAATSTGLYATDTLMGTATIWVRQGDNTIGAVVCDMIDYRVSDGTVVLATHANGIYSATITSVNDIVTVPEAEQSLVHGMNVYPNPATDVVNIRYTLEKASDVEIVILDELGRVIRAVQKAQTGMGEQSAQVNVADLPAGIYYIRMVAGDVVESKGLIVQ